MRALLLAGILVLGTVPLAAAGTSSCWVIEPGFVSGVGSCGLTFWLSPGLIQLQVDVLKGSVGEVIIRGEGPNRGDLEASCVFAYTASACTPVFGIFGPGSGTWTWSARAANANVGGGDARVLFTVHYP